MIQDKLNQFPSTPGVYLMKNDRHEVLYVGKSKNLRARVRSYFHQSATLDRRKVAMVRRVKDIDYIVTESELEALALEASLIKQYKPQYNVILRDDKNYPYIKLTVNEEWPCVEGVRKITNDGALYFGPYIPTGVMRENLTFIRRHFLIRNCRKKLDKPMRPCIEFQMNRCLAPCSGQLEKSVYRRAVEEVKLFLKGQRKQLLTKLADEMYRHSYAQRYEEAALTRDRIRAIERGWETQRVVAPGLDNIDIIGLYRDEGEGAITVFFLRNSVIVGSKNFIFKNLDDLSNEEFLKSFVEQFYGDNVIPPSETLLPFAIETELLTPFLTQLRKAEVKLTANPKGKKGELLNLANENAAVALKRQKEEIVDEILIELRKALALSKVPKRVEAVDISNSMGTESVGAVVAWEGRAFIKDDYRRYKIKTVEGPNDFAMLKEVVFRHFRNYEEKDKPFPDMLLIDGGLGQLGAVIETVKLFPFTGQLAAIAKKKQDRYDRIYLPDAKTPIVLKPDRPSTHLLQKIRDEAHRFAINYHKTLRDKRVLSSPLEAVKGVGRAKRLLLLKTFGSLDAIRNADIETIAQVKGVNRDLAERIKRELTETG
jgi:excinuclease ABC subunit C